MTAGLRLGCGDSRDRAACRNPCSVQVRENAGLDFAGGIERNKGT